MSSLTLAQLKVIAKKRGIKLKGNKREWVSHLGGPSCFCDTDDDDDMIQCDKALFLSTLHFLHIRNYPSFSVWGVVPLRMCRNWLRLRGITWWGRMVLLELLTRILGRSGRSLDSPPEVNIYIMHIVRIQWICSHFKGEERFRNSRCLKKKLSSFFSSFHVLPSVKPQWVFTAFRELNLCT